MVGRSTGIAYFFLSGFCLISDINNLLLDFLEIDAILGLPDKACEEEDGIRFLSSWKSDRRCIRLNQWYCFHHLWKSRLLRKNTCLVKKLSKLCCRSPIVRLRSNGTVQHVKPIEVLSLVFFHIYIYICSYASAFDDTHWSYMIGEFDDNTWEVLFLDFFSWLCSRSDIFCTHHRKSHDDCGRKWRPVPCSSHNRWWTDNKRRVRTGTWVQL